MTEQEQINYQRIAKSINYIHANFKKQPDLNDVAKNIHLSPFHFQRLFTEWAGTSPKKFLQYISLGHAKKLLKDDNLKIADAAYETGLSGTSRLHDLFIKIEGMSPAEYKNGAADLNIHYNFLFISDITGAGYKQCNLSHHFTHYLKPFICFRINSYRNLTHYTIG